MANLPDHYSAEAREAWDCWIAWRKKQKWPCNDRVEKLALRNLAEYEMAGHKPEDVIDYSMLKGYRGLFPEAKKAIPTHASFATYQQPQKQVERSIPPASFFADVRKNLKGSRLQ